MQLSTKWFILLFVLFAVTFAESMGVTDSLSMGAYDNDSTESCDAPVLTYDSLIGKVASTYTDTIHSTNSPDSITIYSGTLPAGLTYNKLTGIYSGMVTDIYPRDSVQFKAWGCATSFVWVIYEFTWDSIQLLSVISKRTGDSTAYIGDTMQARPSFPAVRLGATIDSAQLGDISIVGNIISTSDTLIEFTLSDSVEVGLCTLTVCDTVACASKEFYCLGDLISKPFYTSIWDSTDNSRDLKYRWLLDSTLYETMNGNDLTLKNPAPFSWNQYRWLNKGASGKMFLRDPFYAKGEWSVTIRCRMDSLYNGKYDLFTGGDTSTTDDYVGFYYNTSTNSFFRVRNHSGTTVDLTIDDESVFSEFHTWTLTSKSADSLKLYMDGIDMGSFTSNPVYTDSLYIAMLGYAIDACPACNFTGDIDWVLYHSDSLSAEEVDSLHTNPWKEYSEPTRVFRAQFLGQSNMASKATGTPLDKSKNTLLWKDTTLYRLQDTTNQYDATAGLSMLPSFSATMETSLPTTKIITYNGALSSTGFTAGGSGQFWSDTTDEGVQLAFEVADSIGPVEATIWWGGESDINSDSARLHDSLTSMISKFRNRYGNDTLKFYFVLPYYDYHGDGPNLALRRVFLDVCREDTCVWRVEDARDYFDGFMIDGLHINAAGQDSVGKHIAEFMVATDYGKTADTLFSIDTTASENGSFTVSAFDFVQDSGTVISCVATADEGYVFSGWTGNTGMSSASDSFALTEDVVFSATFTLSAAAPVIDSLHCTVLRDSSSRSKWRPGDTVLVIGMFGGSTIIEEDSTVVFQNSTGATRMTVYDRTHYGNSVTTPDTLYCRTSTDLVSGVFRVRVRAAWGSEYLLSDTPTAHNRGYCKIGGAR